MEFRKIRSSEIDALWKLQKYYKAEIGEDELDPTAKDRLETAIGKGSIEFYGAWESVGLIGCCSVTVGFYIHPEYRHQGLARRLVEFAHGQSGVSSLTVSCADYDVEMYRSLGFSISLGNLLAKNLS